MDSQQRHDMVLEQTYATGVDEWVCPICGRRMLITWEPEFKRTLLKEGDNTAVHGASKSDLSIGSLPGSPTVTPHSDQDAERLEHDPRLAPWLAWLERSDFESLWSDDS